MRDDTKPHTYNHTHTLAGHSTSPSIPPCSLSLSLTHTNSPPSPFNQAYRKLLINDRFRADCESRGVPVSRDMDDDRVVAFLADVGTIGDWALEVCVLLSLPPSVPPSLPPSLCVCVVCVCMCALADL